jgi:hypothetical protein
MKKPFRSVEAWKSALMTLPDGPFFELLRSVFGNVKTPFNKQKLLEDLAVFLSREDIRKTISLYIDETDAALIAAIALLQEPLPGELESFFSGDMSAAGIQDLLLNLEERFIIYRFREDGLLRLALNPVLEPVLAPFVEDSKALFPKLPPDGQGSENTSALAGDCLIAGIVSFILEEPCFFKSASLRDQGGAEIRKKIMSQGSRIFPGIDLGTLAGGLYTLGLFRIEGERLFPDEERLRTFGNLSSRERLEYWAAGIYCFETGEEPFNEAAVYLNRNRIRTMVKLFSSFLGALEEGALYPLKTLKRRLIIFERENAADAITAGAVFAGYEIHSGCFFNALEKTGLIIRTKDGAVAAYPAAAGESGMRERSLAMDAPFSWIVYPGIAFADVLSLAFFSAVREAGAAVRFELTRDSAVRGFDRGISAEEMIGLFGRLSGNRINDALAWTLKDWEKRYGEVALIEGAVLTLSEDRRYLAEAEPLRSLIGKTLAPGIYLLPAAETETAAGALIKAGVDIIARHSMDAPTVQNMPYSFFPAVEKAEKPHGWNFTFNETPDSAAGGRTKAREEIKDRFRGNLAKLSLTKEERAELSSRIERRLILSESQLDGASIRYEKLEARGLDYAGKANIARQAIASKSLIEVTWPHRGDTAEVRGIPTAIEKKGEESVLVLDPAGYIPAEQAPGEAIRIPLGKISLLRRIKKSIFGE